MSGKPSAVMSYQRGDASADEIQAVVDEALRELNDPASDAAGAARAVNLDPGQMAGAAVAVKEGGQGAEPILTAILIGITVSEGSKAADALWRGVLWPRIKKLLGARALGAEDGSRDTQ